MRIIAPSAAMRMGKSRGRAGNVIARKNLSGIWLGGGIRFLKCCAGQRVRIAVRRPPDDGERPARRRS